MIGSVLKVVAIAFSAVAFVFAILIPVFERIAPARIVRAYQRLSMPLFMPLYGVVPGTAIIETTGRRTGQVRRVPVAARRNASGVVWLVAGVGRDARYVKNIEANPRVRVRTQGRWWSGTATLCPDDDARRRMFKISLVNGFFLLIAGGDHLSVRIDLDPAR
jgi:deazaflavin-dependent oxidoreductase (nitroreductase family)